ncbi:MAG: hypothetical protein R3266_03840 [Gemmatimonadota bacterium]|nr:hypothetical protein [Gemmatimonadota bacterium]
MRSRKFTQALLLAALAVPLAACGDDDTMAPPPLENPSTVIVENRLEGPVLFFRVRTCGTTAWGDDLLPSDPVNGRINPGEDREFVIEAGCYDFQAQHLPDSSGPGQLVTKETFDRTVSPVAITTWTLMETPSGPA